MGGFKMSRVKVSENKEYLVRDGKPFFYFADTVWMAFSKLSIEDWEEYTDYRRMQNFSVLQISILPISHDNSESEDDIPAFKSKADGSLDFFAYNEEYFEKADRMLKIAVDKGFVPCLHLLWVNYIPDTWASEKSPATIMPIEAVRPLVKYVANRYKKYEPIYSVTGDTKFETDRVCRYYLEAFDELKREDPEGITTMHLSPHGDPPDVFIYLDKLDFYSYQGCHIYENQSWNYELAKKFLSKPVKRPVINTEPPYEGHGHGFKYGRFNEFDVRKAVWQSLLSGAKAGVSYGAHGVWSCHRRYMEFKNIQFSGKPYEWRTALRFKGAWDVSFARWIFETYNLFDLEVCDSILDNHSDSTQEIKMSGNASGSKVVIYVPYAADVKVGMDLSRYDFVLINLAERYFAKPEIETKSGISIIRMHDFNSDVLLIGVLR